MEVMLLWVYSIPAPTLSCMVGYAIYRHFHLYIHCMVTDDGEGKQGLTTQSSKRRGRRASTEHGRWQIQNNWMEVHLHTVMFGCETPCHKRITENLHGSKVSLRSP